MLDIGFPELLLVTLVILLVFGPERLPEVLRTLGGWIGQARRSFTSLKTEIEREIGADEIRRDLHNARILEEAAKVREEIRNAGEDMRASQEEIDTLMRKRMAALNAEEQAASDALPDAEDAAPDADAPARREDPQPEAGGAADPGSDVPKPARQPPDSDVDLDARR
ncbi:MAG: twin-arginine translocase subunit TatB [Gammaproteobacteria bacterium]|nr:twin-arginine translocase subunit TatB [Gammaproteobacteria bacterium]